ncbi:hypothetical protein P8C59_003937 [Phyllachora maydis]|uniref:GAG-pre-integrase domain-containing protein n=1 Tax=Phyllachora maydis TaxID=1825666 RepID=A0AAD9I1D4_9PEZI|nr:hypothetical protein P8C59_003937 [Phyllachora maydis]
MADQAKGKGIAPKRASNPADPGQSSRPPLPIQTLLEDEEDGEDYSEVIKVLKQYIKSNKRVIASQSSDIKTLLLSLNTLEASVKDSVSAIMNISSTLASLTNSSNAAATTIGKTSYSPRFDPLSGTMDLDSPPRPPRKEPHLGPAVNSATSNLDPPIDTGSKEGFKDTIIGMGGCTDADSIPFDSKGLIIYIYVLLKQAATLRRKEEAEEKAVYKAEIATYKVYISKPAKYALPISLAIKKAADTSSNDGQSSRPPPPIRTLSEDKEDSEDYSEVIEVLKQHIKSHERVIASQSSDIKTLLLSLNTLKASVKDSVSAIKNISSTLASLTNSSNAAAATIGKTSYSPRFDPFSSTIDLDSPPHPPRKEPHLGPAVDNTATSNLDPPIDTGSKEGFKDTITSSIVKELSKKAYTIPDDRISNFLENPNISNTYSNSDQAVLLMLLRNSLSSSPRAAISWIHIPSKAFKLLVRQYSRPIESKKEDVYNEFHALTFSTYKKGLSAFNAEFNGYLTKLTIAKIDIDPSLILNQNPATEAYRAAHVANSSNSTPNSNSNPSKKGKNKKKGKKKASYNIKGQNYSTKSAEQASFMLGSYNLAIEEEEEESDSSSNSSSSSDSNTQLAQLLALKGYEKRKDFKEKGLKTSSNNKAKYKDNQPRRHPRDPALYNSQLRPINTGNGPVSPAGIGSITLEVLSRKAPPTYTKLVLDNVLYLPNIDINIVSRRNKIVVEIPSNSIRKEDYRPIIEDAIVSEAIEPNKRYKLRNSPAKGTTLEGAPYKSPRKTREPEPLTGTRDLPRVLREPVIEGNKVVEKAISSPTLKEPNIGQRDYYNLLNLAKLWHVRLGHIGLRLLKKTSSITKGLPNFDKIKEADFHCSSYNRGKAVRRVSKALIPDPPRVLDSIEGDTVKIRPRPYNRNPIVLLLVNRKTKRGIKFSTSAPYIHEQNGLVERSVRVILDLNSTAITNKETTPFQALFDELEPGIPHIPNLEHYRAIEGELVDLDLDLEGAISPDPSNLNTEKPISIEIGPSKLEPYESSSDSELDEPLPDKPINPVIVESTRPTISIRKPELPEAFPQTIEPIFCT